MPTWIVERGFSWIGRHLRMSSDGEYRVPASEALIAIGACARMLRRLAPGRLFAPARSGAPG